MRGPGGGTPLDPRAGQGSTGPSLSVVGRAGSAPGRHPLNTPLFGHIISWADRESLTGRQHDRMVDQGCSEAV